MFERFTERARRALFFARFEASRLGSSVIDTEHLLLGLVREGDGLTNRLFADAGVASSDIRAEVLRRVPRGPTISTSVEIPFSGPAKGALLHAAQEADRLSHDYIGTEHLLLGLLREQGSVAEDVLTSRGLRLDRVRERVVEFLSDGEQPGHPGPPGTSENTFQWSPLRFVPSRAVHTLYSELKRPQPVTTQAGSGLQACGYTLTEAIVQAWGGSRWHVDIVDGFDDGTRYDFYIQLAENEPGDTVEQMWRDAIEQQFGISVTRDTQSPDLWVVRRR
jgi:ATP-dependent Clp protease ATP-binding subunit ClpA